MNKAAAIVIASEPRISRAALTLFKMAEFTSKDFLSRFKFNGSGDPYVSLKLNKDAPGQIRKLHATHGAFDGRVVYDSSSRILMLQFYQTNMDRGSRYTIQCVA